MNTRTSHALLLCLAIASCSAMGGCASRAVRVHGIGGGAAKPPRLTHRIAVVTTPDYENHWSAGCDTCFVRALRSRGFVASFFGHDKLGVDPGDDYDMAKASGADAVLVISPRDDWAWTASYGFGPLQSVSLSLRTAGKRGTYWRASANIPLVEPPGLHEIEKVCGIADLAVARMVRRLVRAV